MQQGNAMSNESLVNELTFRIHHTMLPVVDLDRSIDFYTRLLGMTVMGRGTDATRKVEVGHVGYGERETQPSFELTQDTSEDAPAGIDPIDLHVALQVSDLRKLRGVLEKQRVGFIKALKASGPDNRRLTAWIRDPDGHAIELIQIGPSA
jgi:lactoylglutathione lyase